MPVRVEATADGRFGTNSYLVEDEAGGDAVVIDANFEPDLVIDAARRRGVTVRAILLTHTDVDHVAGIPALLAAFPGVPVAVHPAERPMVADGVPLRPQWPLQLDPVPRVELLEPGSPYRAGSLEFEVLATPGHSPGGVSLRIGGVVFTGDALFAGSVGRSDFANSDGAALVAGIREQLLALPDETLVYSGHGPVTTIGQERRYNPFL